MRTLAVLVALVAAVCAEQFSYEGYKVYRVQPSSENQLKTLAAIGANEHVDFWSPLRFNGKPIDVMVAPPFLNIFVWSLIRNGIQYEALIDNVESVIREERGRQLMAPRAPEGRIDFMQYYRPDEINEYLDRLSTDKLDIVTVEVVGQSYQGRDLKVIQVSLDPTANKPIIFVDAGIHAQEWIAPAQALYIIQQLTENYTNTYLLNEVDWHILPVVNPDGYEYSHAITCEGTDANRNFGFHWGEIGASANECADTYMGAQPFSEVETQAVRDYITKYKDNIKLYLTFHSYGEYLLFPWGFTWELPDDNDELQSLGDSVADAIRQVKGTEYAVGTSTNVLYAAAGGSDDWAKGVAGVELSYTIELPGGGRNGFDPPAADIYPIVTETREGVKVYHDYIQGKFGHNTAA